MKTLMLAMILSATLTGGSIYDFKAPGLTGRNDQFFRFQGKNILIVNTASKCAEYSSIYDDLEKLYEKYKDKLVVVGFPANNFGAQEPGANGEIAEFCKKIMVLLSLWRKKFR